MKYTKANKKDLCSFEMFDGLEELTCGEPAVVVLAGRQFGRRPLCKNCFKAVLQMDNSPVLKINSSMEIYTVSGIMDQIEEWEREGL